MENINYFDKKLKSTQAGFSLLEMVIAILIFAIVSGSMFALLELGRSERNRTSRRGDTQKNARIAMYLISRDVMNAGLGYHKTGGLVPDDFLSNRLGVPYDSGNGRDTLTSVSSANNVATNVFLPASQKTDAIAFTYRDLDYNDGKPVAIVDEIGSGTQIILQAKSDTDMSKINVNDLFLAETKSSQIVGIITSKNDGAKQINIDSVGNLGLNQPRNGGTNGSLLRKCSGPTDTNCTTYSGLVGGEILLKKIEMVSYQVSNNGTLLRTLYGNNLGASVNDQIQQRAIAYGVENFQLRYQLKDGTVVDDPVVGIDGIRGTLDDTPLGMNDVRYVSISLTGSSTEVDEKTGKPEVITINGTFSLRNMSYDDK